MQALADSKIHCEELTMGCGGCLGSLGARQAGRRGGRGGAAAFRLQVTLPSTGELLFSGKTFKGLKQAHQIV